MKKEDKKVLKELGREDILFTFHKWRLIINWKGWDPLGHSSYKSHNKKLNNIGGKHNETK